MRRRSSEIQISCVRPHEFAANRGSKADKFLEREISELFWGEAGQSSLEKPSESLGRLSIVPLSVRNQMALELKRRCEKWGAALAPHAIANLQLRVQILSDMLRRNKVRLPKCGGELLRRLSMRNQLVPQTSVISMARLRVIARLWPFAKSLR